MGGKLVQTQAQVRAAEERLRSRLQGALRERRRCEVAAGKWAKAGDLGSECFYRVRARAYASQARGIHRHLQATRAQRRALTEQLQEAS